MKHIFFTFILLINLWSCTHTSKENPKNSSTFKSNSLKDALTKKDTLKAGIKRIFFKGEWKFFALGDINNDKISDTAFIYTPAYYAKIYPGEDQPDVFDCVDNNCFNLIRFSSNLPGIKIKNTVMGTVEAINDLDEDGIKEIIFQTNWWHGSHVSIYIYSLNKNKWVVLAENWLYAEDNYKDRIKKINKGKFRFKVEYMDTVAHDISNKFITVKINKKTF